MIRARCGASVLCWCGGPLSLGLLGGPRPCSGDTATQRGRRRAACRVHGAADLVLMDHIARSPSCRSVAAGSGDAPEDRSPVTALSGSGLRCSSLYIRYTYTFSFMCETS